MNNKDLRGSLTKKIDEVNARNDVSKSYKKAYIDGVLDTFDLIINHVSSIGNNKEEK